MTPSYRLMTPGPVALPQEVLEALQKPLVHHRTPEFESLFGRVLTRLPKVFGTTQPAFVLTATGTGAMEAALMNTLSPKEKVLVITSGKFGERWAEQAEVFNLQVERIQTDWGKDIPLEAVENQLRSTQYAAVLMQACETSTGAWLPVQQIAALVHKLSPETLMIVDGITALGACPMPMDEWHLDVVIGGSQKGFMLPTGLSFISLSKKAWQKNANAQLPRYYWDLREEKKANDKKQTRFSSAVTLITALDAALDIFEKRGLQTIHRRTAFIGQQLRAGCKMFGFKLFPETPSDSLSCFRMPAGILATSLRQGLEDDHKITIMAGQDHLKDDVIRIGHMGHITSEDVFHTLEGIGETLRKLQPSEFLASHTAKAVEAAKSVKRS